MKDGSRRESGHSKRRLYPERDVLRDRNDLRLLAGCADFVPNSFSHQEIRRK
jgi:hypothetical protein